MANSKVQYTADGSTQSFAVTFPFISRSHVDVRVDGVSSTFTWDSDSQITISSPTLSGSEVVLIIRTTSQATRLIDYVDGSNLSESDLDTDSKQAFFMAQESLDELSTIDNGLVATDTHILVADGTKFTNVAMSGDATLANTGAITIANGSIDLAHMSADSVDGSKIVDDAINSEHYTDGSIDLAHMSADSVDGSKIVDDAIDSEHYTDGSIDSAHIGDDQIVTAKILDGDVTLAKLVDATATNKVMGRVATGSGDWEEVTLQTTLSSSDEAIPTSKAVRDDIVSIVNDVGGFHAIADDQSFPNANPDPDDGAGTVVSIANAGGLVVNGSGVSTTGRTLGSSTVTINNIPATYQSTTIADSLGMHVISTTTLNTYNYHKMIAKEGDTNIVSTNIANVNTVAGISSDVTTVAGISSDVTAVAGDASDIGAVAAKATEIGRLGTADAVADMAILGTADVVSDLNTLGTADIVTDMNTLGTAGNVTAMATCATNVADINRYSDEYTIASSAPGSPSEGDLWYDSTNNVLKVYNGTSFVAVTSATAGILSLADDTTPALGGFLDANGNYIQMQKGGDIASASPTVIDTDGDYFICTGTTGFTTFTVAADRHFFLEFSGALTMTHGAGTLDLPGGANITTAAGDVGEFVSTASNVVTCVNYTRAGGIVNADINASAAIATSKLSGAVTSITSHGLAASATTDTTSASNISSGTLPDARFPATLPTASGANLTSLPAGNLTGTVADARISTLTASKLSGALPAIDGSSLTGITTGATISASDPAIDTNATLGTQWANSTSGEFFVCTDATTDENVWTNVGDGTGDIEPAPPNKGSRGVAVGGHGKTSIDYFTIASTGNAVDFGDQLADYSGADGMCSNITRGTYSAAGANNTIEYITIASTGNGTDFGNRTIAKGGPRGASNGTRGIMAGANNGGGDVTTDYITIASTGNALDFGDLLDGRGDNGGGEDDTRHVVMGGDNGAGTNYNRIDYFTMASTGNATDFGDTVVNYSNFGGCSGGGRAMAFGGSTAYTDMHYVTIQTTGNSADFGDLTVGARGCDGASNDTRGVRTGGYNNQTTMDYWAMLTTGNAVDFGDLNDGKQYNGCFSGVPL